MLFPPSLWCQRQWRKWLCWIKNIIPTKVTCHFLNFRTAAAMFIKVVSRLGIIKQSCTTEWNRLRHPYGRGWGVSIPISKTKDIREKMIYTVVKHLQFNMKRHLVDINLKNRTVKTCFFVCMCVFSYPVTRQSRESSGWTKLWHEKMVLERKNN